MTSRKRPEGQGIQEEESLGGASRSNPLQGSEPLGPVKATPGVIARDGRRENGHRPFDVRLNRTKVEETDDAVLWAMIREAADRVAFPAYQRFMDEFLADPRSPGRERDGNGHLPFSRVNAYGLLKAGTETFLETHAGVVPPPKHLRLADPRLEDDGGEPYTLEAMWNRYALTEHTQMPDGAPAPAVQVVPYLDLIRHKLREYPVERQHIDGRDDKDTRVLYALIEERLVHPPMVELIWSYWHEEGMLAQTMAALVRRFQNVRSGARDPLANLEIDPLRPLSNILWGYVQDEQHRLSVVRRAYEYDHQYGFTLHGDAIKNFRPIDSRSKFLEAFHNLLHMTNDFFRQDDDTTVVADGFPILNALKEVHLLLTQGGHNQYGDLPWAARQEMLMDQWILARPEMREFIGGRVMVAYPEAWMDRVDSMKALQSWDDTTSVHFRDLGAFGEQILLSIRYGAWVPVILPDQAANWARYWRPEIQGYIHAYRAVTGVDLRAEATDARPAAERNLPPSVHLRNRLLAQAQSRTAR